MNIGWRPVVWSAAALVLLLSIPTPFNVITLFLLMTPFIVLFTQLRPLTFAAHVLAIGAAAFFLSGAFAAPVVTIMIFFLVPSIVMGYMYKKGKKAWSVVLAGFAVILAQLLLELVLFSFQLNIDLSTEISAAFRTALEGFENNGSMPEGWASDTANALGKAVVIMLPLLLLLFSFLFAIVGHALSRWTLRRTGMEVPGLPQAKNWMLPRSLVWYYLAALILNMALPPDAGGYWNVASANLLPILQYCFLVQTIGFFFFLADHKRWPRAVPIVITVLLFLLFLANLPLYLIGLLDVAFKLRRYFVK